MYNILVCDDDKEIVDTFVLKTIKRFDEKNGANQALLPEFKDDEDQEFARRLFRRILGARTQGECRRQEQQAP